MERQIIKIDEDLCNGCGLCASACHEGAIGMVDGKAKLLRDDYCDGLGNCLPICPTGAITFETREADAFDAAAVAARQLQSSIVLEQPAIAAVQGNADAHPLPCGCPGTHSRAIDRVSESNPAAPAATNNTSQLMQWPVQIQLVPAHAPYFENANLLIAADCTAFAHGDFHNQYIRNHITVIGCPKLDDVDYTEKLTAILTQNNIKSVTIARMEVPCCGGLEHAAKTALQRSGKFIPWQVVVVGTDGRIVEC